MRVISFGRTFVVPLSLVVLALAGISTPSVALRTMLAVVAIGAIGLIVIAGTTGGHESRRIRPIAPADDVVQMAKDEASDLARLGSDAG